MSKRSRSVSLALMSIAPVMLAACAPTPSSSSSSPSATNKPKEPTAYETVDACVFDGNKKADCEQGFKTAQAEALANAPRFATGEECALAFENCKPVEAVATAAAAPAANPAASQPAAPQQASSSFMPLMAGFMLGNAMSGSSGGAGTVSAGFDGSRDERRSGASGSSAGANSVLYRARGGQLSQVSSAANGKPTISPVKARTVTSAQVARAKASSTQARSTAPRSVSRSGFGGRSGGFGG